MKNRELTYYENKIKDNLEYLFKKTGKKKADLAVVLNTTPTSVTRFCKGVSTPSIDQLVAIGNFFNISLNELVGIPSDNDLSDDEHKIITGLRNNPDVIKYVKQMLGV